INQAVLRLNMDDLNGAEREGYEAIRLNPKMGFFYHNLGVILKEKGKSEQALAYLRKAGELDPKNAETQHQLYLVLIDLKRPKSALEALEKALQLDSAQPIYQLEAGLFYTFLVLQGEGQFLQKAVQHYLRNIALTPKRIDKQTWKNLHTLHKDYPAETSALV